MTAFDFKNAKQKIAEINGIVETCPEPLRQRCFELLFEEVFRAPAGKSHPKEESAGAEQTKHDTQEKPAEKATDGQTRKLPPNVLAFTRRQNVTPAELEKLFVLDHEPLLPVYKINTSKTAHAQLHKVMMILLENGLLNNQLGLPGIEWVIGEIIAREKLVDSGLSAL